jgi:hypothetical protein
MLVAGWRMRDGLMKSKAGVSAPHECGDNLARWFAILVQASDLLNLCDPLPRLCWGWWSDCSPV